MAVQFHLEEYVIFDEQGAKVNSHSYTDPRLQECWALTDSNEQVYQPCAAFNSLAKCVILALSQPERWCQWIKQSRGCFIISDLPSVPEIAAVT